MGLGSRPGVIAAQQGQRQLSRLSLSERLDGQVAMVQDSWTFVPGLPQDLQEPVLVGVLETIAAQEEQDGRIRREDQVGQKHGAIHVTPLKIVDHEHKVRFPAQADQQLAEAGEDPHPQFLRVGQLGDWPPLREHAVHAPDHRENTGQERHVVGEQAGELARGELLQMSGQRIDQAIDGLERDPLLLITSSRENERVFPGSQVVQKRSDQRCLARAGPAEDEDRRGLTIHERGIARVEHVAMP